MSGLVEFAKKRGAQRAVRTVAGSRRELTGPEAVRRAQAKEMRRKGQYDYAKPEDEANARFQAQRRAALRSRNPFVKLPQTERQQRAAANAAEREEVFRRSMGRPKNKAQYAWWNIKREPVPAILALTVPTAAYGATRLHSVNKRSKREDKINRRDAIEAGAAAAGGQAVFRATGFGLKWHGNAARNNTLSAQPGPGGKPRLVRGIPNGMSEKKYWEIIERHERKHGIVNYGPKGSWAHTTAQASTPSYSRQYPKELPGWRQKRVLGHLSGRRGMAIETAMTVLPAAAVYNSRRQDRNDRFRKSDGPYHREESVSAPRMAIGVGGLGLVAYGGSRNKVFQSAIGQGMKSANPDVRTAAMYVEAGRQKTERMTGQAIQRIGMSGIGRNLKRVPKSARPGLALFTGATAVRAAVPIKREKYTPYTVQGW